MCDEQKRSIRFLFDTYLDELELALERHDRDTVLRAIEGVKAIIAVNQIIGRDGSCL